MYSLRIVTFTAPTSEQVEAFKAYIGQSSTAADVFLAAILAEAMIHIGEWHNRSLLAATYELEITEREDNAPVKLYCTPSAVSSVKDGNGADLAYTYTAGGRYVAIEGESEVVRIVYSTSVDTGAAATLLPKVWEYGRAKYEGRTQDAAAILMR